MLTLLLYVFCFLTLQPAGTGATQVIPIAGTVKSMPVIPIGQTTSSGPAWFTYPRIDNYAVFPDPEGPFPKPDSNLAVPNGVAITALLAGTITSINNVESWGPTVTIMLDFPLNTLAVATAYLHLGRAIGNVGQHVNAGDIIGIAGPSNSGAEVGFALCNGPHYGVGSGFAHVGDPLLNPVPVLNDVLSGRIPQPDVNNLLGAILPFGTNPFTPIANSTHALLNNIPGFAGIVDALDNVEQFQPFTFPSDPKAPDANTFILGGVENFFIKSANLPSDAIQGALIFMVSNTMAFLVRAVIVSIGLILLISLIKNALDSSGIGQVAMSGVALATM